VSQLSVIPHASPAALAEGETQVPSAASSAKRYLRILLVIFVFTLPLVNPWVRGDGVGYYAYVRALLVEHKLDFTKDWLAANDTFTMGRVNRDGSLNRRQYTVTGHIDNHWAVGASIFWAPFEIPVHVAMLTLQGLGFSVKADGFSRPYTITMALATALCGFLGLYFSFRFASRYIEEQWAFLATLGIWFASSLPVYMYFNPAWSHAQSVFIVSIFLCYWQRTQPARTLTQWSILGLISGLVLDVHYLNVAVLMVPLVESLQGYWRAWKAPCHDGWAMLQLFGANVLYLCFIVVGFLPTLITRDIIYGSPLRLGYSAERMGFRWDSPHFWGVLFASEHGMLLWTPILILALVGFFLLLRRNRTLGVHCIVVFVTLLYLLGADITWNGISSFGNRYFISLTPFYVLGLAATFSEIAKALKGAQSAMTIARAATAVLIVWNMAFIFQWGTHMVPVRGPISWRQMIRNQFIGVPEQATGKIAAYFENRRGLMNHIEQDDIGQLQERRRAAKTR
jgi:hypothetical protein